NSRSPPCRTENRNMADMKKAALALLVASLSACAIGPDYQQPATELPANFEQATPQKSADDPYTSDAPIASFWTVFGDEMLDKLVAQALEANHDIRVAAANLQAARAIRGAAQADLFP